MVMHCGVGARKCPVFRFIFLFKSSRCAHATHNTGTLLYALRCDDAVEAIRAFLLVLAGLVEFGANGGKI